MKNKRELVVATRNKKKLKEIKALLKGFPLKIVAMDAFGKLPRIIENGKTFKANAVKKAVKIASATGQLTIGEDSGLCVRALDGRPGVYSSRFAGKNKSDIQNNEKLLRLMKDVPYAERGAYYVCAVALADKSGLIGVVEGRCDGRIAFEPKGTAGFGYDPLFLIPKYRKTFGQLGMRIKHKMSHRFKGLVSATKMILQYLAEQKAD